MARRIILSRAAGAAAVWSMAAVSAHATGFDLPDQDPYAIGRGMAFVATADNPSAVYYNPAGITQLEGHQVRAGAYGLYMKPSYVSPTGASSHSDRNLHAIPQVFYTYSLPSQPLSFGLGVYSPFGLSSRWPQDSGFRTVAIEGKLTTYTLNPVVAWKITPELSIAAGLTASYAELDLKQGLVWPAQALDEFRFKGDAWSAGYNLGAHWKPHPKLAFGLSFRSSTTAHLEGRTEAHNDLAYGPVPAFTHRSDAQASYPFPLKTICGVSYRPTPDWNFEFNADFTDWRQMGVVNIHQAAGLPGLLPQDVPVSMKWEGSWYYELGATRQLGRGWSASAGYIYNENSVPDSQFNPLVSDLDRHFWSVGVGRKGRRLSFDAAYQFGYGPSRQVSGSAPSPYSGQSADGRYSFLSHAISASALWQF